MVKLVIREAESSSLRAELLRAERVWSSEISEIEVTRAARRRRGERGVHDARYVFTGVELVAPDRQIRSLASELEPASLRSLDAIQIVTALSLNFPDVVFMGYDLRCQEAAAAAGLEIQSPGA